MTGGSLAGNVSSRASSNRFSRCSSQSRSGTRFLSVRTGFFELNMFVTFQRSLIHQRLAAPKVLNFPPSGPANAIPTPRAAPPCHAAGENRRGKDSSDGLVPEMVE